MKPRQQHTWPYYMRPGCRHQESVRENVLQQVKDWPKDKPLKATLCDLMPTRNEAQNALCWVWNHEIAEQRGDESAPGIPTEDKLDILLPMMFGWEGMRTEAGVIKDAVLSAATREHQLMIAERCIRSSELKVKPFCEYLDARQQVWAERGIVLTTKCSEYDHAMGVKSK